MNVRSLGARRLVLGVLCFIFLIFGGTTIAKASSLEDTVLYESKKQTRTLLDDVESVSDIEYMRARNGHLNYGSIELIKVSPTRVRIGATTQAHHVCPEIYMDIYLDQYDTTTGHWNQLRYWEYSTKNSQHLTKNMEIIVPSGYYYSIRGAHSCVHGNVVESAETMTDGLYIGITDEPVIKP